MRGVAANLHMEEATKRATFKEGFAAVWNQIRPFKREVSILTVLGLISAAANGSVPYITGRFFDALIELSQGNVTGSGLPIWGLLLAAWVLIQLVANNIDWIIDRMRRGVEVHLHIGIQAKGFLHLIRLPLGFHKNERINEIIERFNHASWRVSAVFRIVVNFAPQLLSVVVGVVLAFTIHPLLASVLLAGVALYGILLLAMLRSVAERDETVLREWNESWGNAASVVHQAESVKQATAEEHETAKIRSIMLGRVFRGWKSLQLVWSNVGFFQRILVFATQLAVFLFSIRLVADSSITVGELIALNGYAQMFFGPFVTLGYSWEVIQNGLNSAKQIQTVLDQPEEVYQPKGKESPAVADGSVRFENVSFGYGGKDQVVLRDISFEAKPGEVIAFVGESGVGKSTAISLISGYFFPEEGAVYINGVDTRKYDLVELRKQIAVVPQEVALFNDTIRENIWYGSFDASQADIERAAQEAQIAEFIDGLPKKYETVVGERGVKLSVGQKQRVAIARAMLRNPSILILDEPTSALDARTEQYVTESFEKLMKGRTTFIIAHRLSTVRKADKILVFKKGRVVEEGKHDTLIKRKDGVYRRLYEYQIGLHQ